MIRYLLGNGLWMLAGTRARSRYRRARRDPRRAQEAILFDFLRRNAGTDYGRAHRYDRIRTVRDFQESVPVVTYEELEPWIDRIRHGRPNVLTAEPVVMMEKTSGSSGPAKYIPYTRSLRREFQEAIGAWMVDLFRNRPGLLTGAQYWSISPSARQKETTPGGIPVGFDDDTEYLDPLERRVVGWVMAVPGDVCRISDMEENRRVTLRHLMACRRLGFMSVWNPSFLTILMSRLPDGARPAELWPQLKLISCWTSAVSARFVPAVRALFPNVEIQGKGLVATEGVISFPEIGRPAPSPALTSHFLEFVGEEGRARLVDELDVGRRYSVVITTGGGLARYALGDTVEVVAPGAIEFVGKGSHVSDVCGEKLSEAFVGPILDEASSRFPGVGFAMLAPEWAHPPHYALLIESDRAGDVAEFVERRLRASVHYDYCRRLGQLGAVRGVPVSGAGERYLRACERLGQRAGNIKPACLRREFGWRWRLGEAS
ncbi:MAG: GH3 auxin-responsive promoter family protein [Planctomycetes bacterium]|nr:GH3 auxin-responsive promoter family protein [Planctomycetota bacterium]